MLAVIAPLLVAAVAFVLRIAVHAGRTPGGVDTWYYLAYADAFRRRPSFDVRLPQYLLQDERQSYPPLFPSLLALFPSSWLRRWYWTLSPAIDCVHLLLLYFVAFRLTASPVVATIAAATYAFTPQLISETRSLSPRPFGALLHSVAMILLLKYTLTSGHWTWAAAAALAAALLYLSSAALAAAYAFVCTMLSAVFLDPRDVAVAVAGLLLATLLSGGHMLRVVRNYVFAVQYWRRNRHLYGRHPVHDSPVLGSPTPTESRRAQQPGFMGETTARQLVRLLGENPFLLAVPFAPRLVASWSMHLYWWAIGLATLSVIATILPPLRAFGPGRSYMKAAIFPTAYTLASGIGTTAGLMRPAGLVTIACLVASIGAIAFFYLYARGRSTEQTASVPEGLQQAVQTLAALPPGSVFVLPYIYADYVCYWSGKPVVWGGHCGDHRKFEWVTPVISRPLDQIFRELDVRYVLLQKPSADLDELRLGAALPLLGEAAGFGLHRYDSM
jgi:hypothetical protein